MPTVLTDDDHRSQPQIFRALYAPPARDELSIYEAMERRRIGRSCHRNQLLLAIQSCRQRTQSLNVLSHQNDRAICPNKPLETKLAAAAHDMTTPPLLPLLSYDNNQSVRAGLELSMAFLDAMGVERTPLMN